MNNKKGFTLVEIIICISLLAIIGVGSIVGIITVNKNITKKELKQIENKIFDAVNIYLESHKEVRDQYYEKNNGILIPLNVLKDEGYMEFQNIDIDNHYVVSLLGSEDKDDKCINNVKVGSWELEEDIVVYLCSDSDLKKQIEELQNKIKDIEDKLKDDPNNDIKSKLTSGDGYYIAKGENPNNWVEFNVVSKTGEWTSWNTKDEDLWRIMSIDEEGRIRLIYNDIVSTDNFKNFEKANACRTRSNQTLGYVSDARKNGDYYCKIHINCYGVSSSDYEVGSYTGYVLFKYNSSTIWTSSEITSDYSDPSNIDSSANACYNAKKIKLYNNISNKNYLESTMYKYNIDENSISLYTAPLLIGYLNQDMYDDSKLGDKSYLNQKNVVSYFSTVYTSLQNGNQVHKYDANKNTNFYYKFYDISGTNYQPVITLKSEVKIISGSGTKTDPYKLSCDGC